MFFFSSRSNKVNPVYDFYRVYKNANKFYFGNYFSIVSFSQLNNPGGK